MTCTCMHGEHNDALGGKPHLLHVSALRDVLLLSAHKPHPANTYSSFTLGVYVCAGGQRTVGALGEYMVLERPVVAEG